MESEGTKGLFPLGICVVTLTQLPAAPDASGQCSKGSEHRTCPLPSQPSPPPASSRAYAASWGMLWEQGPAQQPNEWTDPQRELRRQQCGGTGTFSHTQRLLFLFLF